MVTIRPEIPSDVAARERLLDRAFGRNRHRKTSQKLRDGRATSPGLAFTALSKSGKVIGTIRLWDIVAGSAGASLLLGPLAVDSAYKGRGIGSALMQHALLEAEKQGHASVVLVGDAPYYSRFGFRPELVADLHMPGPVERNRFLGLELAPGALDGAEGLLIANGDMEAKAAAEAAA